VFVVCFSSSCVCLYKEKQTKNTTQYVFDTTLYKQTQDEEKQTKNTTQYMFDTTIYKQTQDEEKQTTNTTQYMFDTTLHKTKKIKPQTQHNMCLTPLYTRRRKTNQKHNTVCV
jgi:hypothetical protein